MESPFISQCILSLIALFFGLSAGQIIKLLTGYRKSSCVFSFLCIFATVLVLLYTFFIFQSHSLSPFPVLKKSFLPLLTAIFFWGVALSLFWKILIPVSAVLYASITFFTYKTLNSVFQNQKEIIPLTITENSITFEDKTLEYQSDKILFLKVELFRLPDSIVLPLKRNWYSVSIVSEIEGSNEENHVLSLKLKNKPADFYFHKVLVKKISDLQILQMPQDKVFPSLYSLRIPLKDASPACKIIRDL